MFREALMTKIKICGIRSADNALMAAREGADIIGLNFFRESPRYVAPELAAEIASRLRAELGTRCPKLAGVFVNAPVAEIRAIVAAVGLDYAQLSGDESGETVAELPGVAFKAIRPADEAEALEAVARYAELAPKDEGCPSLLLDAYHPRLYGGTGESASASIASAVQGGAPRLMLAGGLRPENVAERVEEIQPWGVDVASGVEAGEPGMKDPDKVRAFVAAVRPVGL